MLSCLVPYRGALLVQFFYDSSRRDLHVTISQHKLTQMDVSVKRDFVLVNHHGLPNGTS